MKFLLTLATTSTANSIASAITLKYFIDMIQPIIILIMIFIIMCILKNTEEEIKITNKRLERIIKNNEEE